MNQTSAEDGEQMPALTSLITLTAAALFFITDQHLELLRALIQSYNVFHFGADFGGNNELAELGGSPWGRKPGCSASVLAFPCLFDCHECNVRHSK